MAYSYLKRDPDRTTVAWSFLLVRLIVGVIFIAHGAQKLFGWFGGSGIGGLAEGYGLPLAYLIAIGECFGGLGILVGVLSRFSALANIVIMVGAIVQVHGKNGFFMKEGGFEYNLALIGLLLPILLAGPGPYTVLRPFFKKIYPIVE
jgi:putative oxidoreductase